VVPGLFQRDARDMFLFLTSLFTFLRATFLFSALLRSTLLLSAALSPFLVSAFDLGRPSGRAGGRLGNRAVELRDRWILSRQQGNVGLLDQDLPQVEHFTVVEGVSPLTPGSQGIPAQGQPHEPGRPLAKRFGPTCAERLYVGQLRCGPGR
jgi:hypothetical protein